MSAAEVAISAKDALSRIEGDFPLDEAVVEGINQAPFTLSGTSTSAESSTSDAKRNKGSVRGKLW